MYIDQNISSIDKIFLKYLCFNKWDLMFNVFLFEFDYSADDK